jgi:hypothetical protein
MPAREQIRRFRELAQEAEAMACGVPSRRLQEAWEKIARDWRELADELEQSLDAPNAPLLRQGPGAGC